jgi:quaternary ammonium compound-resistance protein SugE
MSPWISLVVAGLLEVAWATGLKFTDGFTRPLPSAFTVAAIAGSMLFLARAAQTIPLGTAYGIWVGIGAVGSVTAGALLFGEAVTVARIACVAMLIAAIVGLKVTNPA